MTLFGGNRSIAVNLTLNPAGLKAGLAVARKEMTDFARAGAVASQKHKRAYDDVARGIGVAGLALGAFAALSVGAFARFDKAMSRAGAGTQATATQMTALRAAALKAGADTQFSATQAADAITEMGKAGVSVKDILGGGLAGTLALAAAGELDVAKAAEIAATTMNQFGLSGDKVGHVADVLAAGAAKAQGSVEDLANGLKYVGPVAASMGVSLEQTTGVLAEFASQGIIGEQAGTGFRGLLLSLVSPSKIAQKTMDALGISMYDANGKFIGMEGAAQELQEKLSDLGPAQRNAALGTIFGNEQVTAATILYKGGAGAVHDWTDKVNDAGFAAEQAAKLMDNLSGDVEKLKGSLETAFIAGGSGGNEGLRSLTQSATSAVNAFVGLPPAVQKGTVQVAALGAGLLLVTAAAFKTVGGIASARRNMQELGASSATTAGALRGVGAALGVVTIAVPIAAAGFDKINAATTRTPPGVKETTVALLDFAQAGKGAGAAADVLGSDFAGVVSTAKSLSGFSGGLVKLGDQAGKVSLPLRALGKPLEEQRAALDSVDQALAGLVSSGHVDEAAGAFNRLSIEAAAQGLSIGDLKKQLPGYQEALAGVASDSKAAAEASGGYSAALRGAKTAAGLLSGAQEELATALDASNNKFLTGRSASRDYQAAIDAAQESVKTNGKTLDENTEKGRANEAALDGLAASSLKYLGTLTGANGEATPKFNAALKESRTNLIATAHAMGASKEQAEALAHKILDVPAAKVVRVTMLNLQAALAGITTLRENLGRIPGTKTVFFRAEGLAGLRSAAANARDVASADGNIIRYYGSGGVERHVAQIARPANTVRVWAEPETGGEAYIPLAASKRDRSKAILKQTAGIFGMQAFAGGGFVQGPFGASDVQQRYQASIPQPITPAQYAAAMKSAADAQGRAANAAASLRGAERGLAQARRSGSTEKIRDAEDRLDRARRASAAARRAEAAAEGKAADATRRRNAGRGFNLGLYINALGSTTRRAEGYRRDLSAVSRRGGSDLAAALEAMGADGAPLIAALVKASPAQFKRVANLLRRLDPSAFGGGVKTTRFALGGIAPESMGGWRVFGEQGTGGEAYIPLGASNQGRSRALTADVAGRLGGQVTWSSHRVVPGSTGVSAAPSSAVTSGGGVAMNVGTVQLLRGGPEDVANDVMFRVRQLGG